MATTLINTGHDVEENQYEPENILHEHGQTEQAQRHDLTLSMLNITANMGWFINDTWSLETTVPVRIVKSEASFLGAEGTALPGFESIHHRNENLVGLSDIVLQGKATQRLALSQEANLIASLSLGLSLPTGNTEPNPDALGLAGLRHQHIFFGRGTFAPVAGGTFILSQQSFNIESWFSTVLPLYENDFGYRANRNISGGIAFSSPLGLENWRLGTSFDIAHDGPAHWDGEPQRNSGRTDFIVGGRASWLLADSSVVILNLKRPVYTKANGGQLAIPIMVSLTFGHSIL